MLTLSVTLHVHAKVLLQEWSHNFYDMTISTEFQQRHTIKSNLQQIVTSLGDIY